MGVWAGREAVLVGSALETGLGTWGGGTLTCIKGVGW